MEVQNQQNLGDMFKTTEISCRSEKSGNTLRISIWGSRMGFTVYGKQASGGNLFRQSIDANQLIVVDSALDNLVSMPPESHQAMTFSHYDRQERKQIIDFQMNLIKDERQVYLIELKGPANNGGEFSDRFSLFLPQGVTLNTEPFKPAESSSYMVKRLRQYFKMVAPTEMALTGRKATGNFGSSAKSGGSNNAYNRGNYKAGGSKGPAGNVDTGNPMNGFEPSSMDDMPF
jgi:hypothetical protein